MEISRQQHLAICHRDGPMLVLAGPGSGKTFTITQRIRHMIKEYHIPPEHILVITFSKASASEMQERFYELMEHHFQPVSFGTFHAIFFQILKNAYHYQNSDIISEKEKIQYMTEIIQTYPEEILDENMVPHLLSDISRMKNEGTGVESYRVPYLPENLYADIYRAYSKRLKQEGKIDFEDMVLLCRDLLRENSECLERWRQIYRYILIDEFQDINEAQFEVVKMLTGDRQNLFAVGDDDQAIYGFRGAKPEIMLRFKEWFPTAKTVVLDENYRSKSSIVESAGCLIKNNRHRYEKKIKAVKKEKGQVVLKGFSNQEEQIKEIIKVVKTIARNGEYHDVAVIFRTNAGMRFLIQGFKAEKIPFVCRDKCVSPYEHWVAKDVLAIMDFANGKRDRKHFLRFMNKPIRYISRHMLKEEPVNIDALIGDSSVPEYVKKNLIVLKRDLSELRKNSPFAALYYIRKVMGYETFIQKKPKKDYVDFDSKKDEVAQILQILQASTRGWEDYEGWRKFVEECNEVFVRQEQTESEDGVVLITMHSAKGLEYKNVILPDLNEGNVPPSKSKTKAETEEERRIFYVAMTRAKERLFLFYLESTKENRLMKSRFLSQIKEKEENSYSSSESTSSSNS